MGREQWQRTPVSFPLLLLPRAQRWRKKREKKVENREEQVREGFRLITRRPAGAGKGWNTVHSNEEEEEQE